MPLLNTASNLWTPSSSKKVEFTREDLQKSCRKQFLKAESQNTRAGKNGQETAGWIWNAR